MITKPYIDGVDGDRLVERISAGEIAARCTEIGEELTNLYGEEPVVALCVLRGAIFFYTDLVRCIRAPRLELDFVRLSSYGQNTKSSGHVAIEAWPTTELRDKHILVIEDIIDSGLSMQCLLRQFDAVQVKSLRVCVLIDKKERRSCAVPIDYACFSLDSGFLVGYGLDYAQKYRHLPAIYELTNP